MPDADLIIRTLVLEQSRHDLLFDHGECLGIAKEVRGLDEQVVKQPCRSVWVFAAGLGQARRTQILLGGDMLEPSSRLGRAIVGQVYPGRDTQDLRKLTPLADRRRAGESLEKWAARVGHP